MLTLPLKWGEENKLEEVRDTGSDEHIYQRILQAITIYRSFEGVSELDFQPDGTPLVLMLNKNAASSRLEYLVYLITRMLRQRCGLMIEGIGMSFDLTGKLSVNIRYRGGQTAIVRL